MSCCAPPLVLDGAPDPSAARQEIRLASRDLGNGLRQSDLAVPGLHCAACIRAVETGLARLPGVAQVRVNLSTRRVAVQWQGEEAPELLTSLAGLGYPGHLFESEADGDDPERDRLIRAL
ncbi:MAG: heavy-metal-associated domain-containing protein, partial [Hyphomicrobiales bacterium]